MIKQLLSYDFGDVLTKYDISLDENNHLMTIKKIYTDYTFLVRAANKVNKSEIEYPLPIVNPFLKSNVTYDLRILFGK